MVNKLLFIILLCRVGINLPTVELRYQNLSVEAECKIVQGKPIPTLWNTLKEWIFVSNFLYFLLWITFLKIINIWIYFFFFSFLFITLLLLFSWKDTTKLSVLKSQNSKISIIKSANGIIKPGRYAILSLILPVSICCLIWNLEYLLTVFDVSLLYLFRCRMTLLLGPPASGQPFFFRTQIKFITYRYMTNVL